MEAWFSKHLIELLRGVSGPGELRRLNRAFGHRYPFLLQSTANSVASGRFDILFAFPGEHLVLQRHGELAGPHRGGQSEFLASLDKWWAAHRIDTSGSELPFVGGWFLYLGYELAAEIEPCLKLRDDPLLPRAFAVRCPGAIIFDHSSGDCSLVLENSMRSEAKQVRADIDDAGHEPSNYTAPSIRLLEDEPENFTAAVRRAKQLISAGDIYQANLSRQWTVSGADGLRSTLLYEALCKANPGAFAGIAQWQQTSIISSSPERLLSVRDGVVATRPIAGTRRRGNDSASDVGLSSELFAHPKERAEHTMLIDLARNDLGRICYPGSVEVDEFMTLESYAHVHHIVSNIQGRIRSDVTPGQAIAAVFPGGTISGCPKVRCMQIIHELETDPRGAYTGSFGYLNRDGSLDLNILIRTMVKHGDKLIFRAGAGIVADSEPLAELDEARAKAEGMLRALPGE